MLQEKSKISYVGELFPLADHYLGDKRFFTPMFGGTISPRFLRAKYTGEKRCPKKGEWYLSGSIVEAYKAPNDLTTAFHIAKIVQIQEIYTEKIIEELNN